MARTLSCDNLLCKNTAKPDAHGMAPAGWVMLQVMDDRGGVIAECCSKPCAIAFLEGVRRNG